MKKKLTMQEEVERDILLYRSDEIWDSMERRRIKRIIREIIEKHRNKDESNK